MQKLIFGLIIGLLTPILAFATWQVTNSHHGLFGKQIITPSLGKTDYPQNFSSNAKLHLQVKKGTLRNNVARFAQKNHWTVIWKTQRSFPVLLNTEISGATFQIVLNQLLNHYPLKAKYNRKNKMVWIFLKKKS